MSWHWLITEQSASNNDWINEWSGQIGQLLLQVHLLLTKSLLTLKALITTAADDIHKYFFIVFQRK